MSSRGLAQRAVDLARQAAQLAIVATTVPIRAAKKSSDTPLNSPGTTIDLDKVSYNGRSARDCLADSGVNTWTDYPLSTSPRTRSSEIRGHLSLLRSTYCRPLASLTNAKEVGVEVPGSRRRRQPMVDRAYREADVQPFSWRESQTRREAAKGEDGELVSPRTRPTIKQMTEAGFNEYSGSTLLFLRPLDDIADE